MGFLDNFKKKKPQAVEVKEKSNIDINEQLYTSSVNEMFGDFFDKIDALEKMCDEAIEKEQAEKQNITVS